MTLTPTNKAIGQENYMEKILVRKKIPFDQGGYKRCKDSIIIKKGQDFVRVGEKGIMIYCPDINVFLIYRTTLSVNGITLQTLSLSILVLH